MKKIYFLFAFFIAGTVVFAQPPIDNPKPGMCYIQCITVDEFDEVTEKVMVSPEYKKLKVIPATFKTVEERVLVKEASKKLVYIPAVYETVDVPYVKKEGTFALSVVPATFGDASRTFVTYPKIGRWEYTLLDECLSNNKEDCVAACFVEYPEQTTTVPQKTLAKDAHTERTDVSKQDATYKKRVVKTPARMEEQEIPAEYATIKRQVVDQPARTTEETVPAEYKTVTRTILVKAGGMRTWEEVDCGLVNTDNLLPIHYEFNSAVLTPQAKNIINEHLLSLMKDKPGLRIQISSHTDSRGNDAYNMSLSQQRAQSVVNYLVANGINRNRLVAKGFGETVLKNRCSNGVDCSEQEHAINRRTEFRILN